MEKHQQKRDETTVVSSLYSFFSVLSAPSVSPWFNRFRSRSVVAQGMLPPVPTNRGTHEGVRRMLKTLGWLCLSAIFILGGADAFQKPGPRAAG